MEVGQGEGLGEVVIVDGPVPVLLRKAVVDRAHAVGGKSELVPDGRQARRTVRVPVGGGGVHKEAVGPSRSRDRGEPVVLQDEFPGER